MGSCGACGGAGCDQRPGGAAECCGGSIKAACTSSVGPPPCKWAEAEVAKMSAKTCSSGVSDKSGLVCCAKECGECGGPSCADRPGGAASCCGGSIKHSCVDKNGAAPCVY